MADAMVRTAMPTARSGGRAERGPRRLMDRPLVPHTVNRGGAAAETAVSLFTRGVLPVPKQVTPATRLR